MQLDCAITAEDVITYNIYVNRSTALFRRRRKRNLLRFTLLASMLVFLAYLVRSNPALAAVLALIALCLLVVGLTTYLMVEAVVRRTTHKRIRDGMYAGVIGQHSLSLTPEAFEDVSANGTGKLLWKAIERIDVTPAAMYPFLSDVYGFIIPRHNFQSETHYQTFAQHMQDYHAAAREQAPNDRKT